MIGFCSYTSVLIAVSDISNGECIADWAKPGRDKKLSIFDGLLIQLLSCSYKG